MAISECDPIYEPSIFHGCAILADDLTGACDTGVQFIDPTNSVFVASSEASLRHQKADMIALNTNCRNDPAKTVVAKIEQCCRELVRHRLLYLKIDSTLRGLPGPQIETTLRTSGRAVALIAPAFPQMGRRLQNGCVRRNQPKVGSNVHVPDLLTAQGLYPVSLIDECCVRRGPDDMLEAVKREVTRGSRAIVVDSARDEDLATVVEVWLGMSSEPLLVGSAGLARQLAITDRSRRGVPKLPLALPEQTATGSIVLVVGSNHPATLTQLEHLAAAIPMHSFEVHDAADPAAEAALRNGEDMLIRLRWRGGDEREKLEQWAALFTTWPPGTLFLSGGDTAQLICELLGATDLQLKGEVSTGISCGRLNGELADGITVILKSGGFGNDDALIDIVRFLGQKDLTET